MKVIFVSNYYPPYYIGGYELSCKDAADYLESCNHSVYVLTSDYKVPSQSNSNIIKEKVQRTLKLINYSTPSYKNKYDIEVHNYNIVKQTIEDIKPDIVCFWNLQSLSYSPVNAAIDCKTKYIFELGDVWPEAYISSSVKEKLKRTIKKYLPFYKGGGELVIDPAICVSSWMAGQMKKFGNKECYIIPRSIKAPESITHKKPHDTTRYLTIGRVVYQKGIDLAIEALGILNQEKEDFNFEYNIAGDGDEAYITACKEIAKKYNIEDKINFIGKVSNLPEVYGYADITLMPTRDCEPFGRVVIESFAYGTPIIATNHTGPSEIIENNIDGLLFEDRDVDDLKNSIEKLHFDKTIWERLRINGYNKVREKYSFNAINSEIENVFLKIIDKD